MYKDYYENLYCVIKGKKIFILLLLSDFLLIFYRFYDLVRYKVIDGGNFEIIEERESLKEFLIFNKVFWIVIDLLNLDLKIYF